MTSDYLDAAFSTASLLKPYRDELQRAAHSHPLVSEGVLHFLFGHFQQAVDVLTLALEQDARLAHAYFLRAMAYCAMEVYTHALGDFTTLLALDSTHVLAYEMRGTVYAAQGRYHEAISDFDAALVLPQCEGGAELCVKRGMAYSGLGEHRLTVESFDRALALGPADVQHVLRRRAKANLWLADVERAHADYALAWRLEPRSCEAWFMSEWTGLCLGPDTPEARAARVERLRQLASVCARVGAAPFESRLGRLCKGAAHWLAGENAAAREVFEAMFPSGEGAGDTCYWLGMVYLSGGDVAWAVSLFASARDHGVQPVLLRLAAHEPRVRHLFHLVRVALDLHSEDEAP